MRILTKPFAPIRHEQIVVVKLWDIFLRYNKSSLYGILSEASVDKGPFVDGNSRERILFRFTKKCWEEKIKELLSDNRIPVVLKSNTGQLPLLKATTTPA